MLFFVLYSVIRGYYVFKNVLLVIGATHGLVEGIRQAVLISLYAPIKY